jgi:hypothetical protein
MLIVYFRRIKENIRLLIIPIAIFLVCSCIVLFIYFATGRSARFQHLSIFSSPGGLAEAVPLFVKNYFAHLSPSFLFLQGDSQLRHSLMGFGELHIFAAPLLLYGLYIIGRRRTKFDLLLLGWFLVFPIPASLTREGIPHALRTIVALPMPEIICAIGAAHITQYLARKYSKAKTSSTAKHMIRISAYCVAIIVTISIIMFASNLYVLYPYYSAFDWQYGVKQSFEYARFKKVSPENVYLSGYITYAPYLALFYDKVDPQVLQERGFRGIPYNYLPPQVPAAEFWDKVTPGSLIVLYPMEEIPVRPKSIIYLPTRTEEEDQYPALHIYRKN